MATPKTNAHVALLERLKKASKIEQSDVLSDSKFFNESDPAVTDIPMLNVALSGQVDGGLTSGLLTIAGPSKHFKTLLALICIAAYMKKHPEAVCMFYDSEFGAAKSYFAACGVDPERVLHNPIENIEVLKFDIIHQLTELKRGDKVCFFIDSIGNLASKKEVEDAIAEKSVADMTRAKALKGIFRMITPFLSTKDVPMIAINHSYQEQTLYPKMIMSGGTGIAYSSNITWMMGRRQEKDADGIQGYHFVINVEKSRMVREKSQIPITVTFAKGIQKYSGLLDVAVELGYVIKPSQGWYQGFDPVNKKELTGKTRADDTNTSAFWKAVFSQSDFALALKNRYQLGQIKMLADDVADIAKDAETE